MKDAADGERSVLSGVDELYHVRSCPMSSSLECAN